MTGSDEDRGRSRSPGAEDQRWSSICRILGGRTIERSGDVVCGLHCAQGGEDGRFVSGLTSKSLGRVYWFGLKIKDDSLSVV
jgi:hypothetical protein